MYGHIHVEAYDKVRFCLSPLLYVLFCLRQWLSLIILELAK